MQMNTTFARIRTLMAAEFQILPESITPETALTDLGVDSLAALEFVFLLEDEFDFTMDNGTDLRGGLVQDVVDAVELALSRQPAAMAAT
jgi:acyl carrier protein